LKRGLYEHEFGSAKICQANEFASRRGRPSMTNHVIGIIAMMLGIFCVAMAITEALKAWRKK
jgi:hypothetical protein